MKPVSFNYVRVRSVVEAASTLIAAEGGARLIAGGQSLGPMLNLRLVQPRLLVDIAGIPELTAVTESSDGLTLGACVTAANIEDGKVPTEAAPMLPRIAGGIAYRAVRNRSTIGGSLCHADPAADWVSTLAALGATCIIMSASGVQRRIPVQDFVTAAFENALSEGEVLQSIFVPRVSKGAQFGYYKITRKTGKFALAMGVVLFDPDRGIFRAVMGATNGSPIVIEDTTPLFASPPGESTVDLHQPSVTALLTRHGIVKGATRQLHLVALRRAAAQAFAA